MLKPKLVSGAFAFLACTGSLVSCSSNLDQFTNKTEIESTDGIGSLVEAQAQQGMSAHKDKEYAIEWFSCTRNVKAPYVVMLNTKDAPFKADACKSGLVQAFLQQDYNVLAVNRPGFGQSEGKEVIGDTVSYHSVQSMLAEQKNTGKILEGLWGFEEASVLAFRLAKNGPFKTLMIGNGIYDWEATLSEGKDPTYVSVLKQVQASSKEGGRFAEDRSIAWDFVGLPKTIYLYHMRNEARFPESQAEAFRAALASNQYAVKLIELKDEKANLTPVVHQSVLIQIAQTQKGLKSE